jgi:sRNA-binding protein
LADEIDCLLGGRGPDQLRDLFDPKHPKPLAIGIKRQIVAELGMDDRKARQLGRLLGMWCGRPSYLEALAADGATRHGIDGRPVEPVTAEHQAVARDQLARWREKWRRRKAAAQSTCRADAALPRLKLGRRS